jgi:hypothetical protein
VDSSKNKSFYCELDCGIFPYKVLLIVGESDANAKRILRLKSEGLTDEDIEDALSITVNDARTSQFYGGNMIIRMRMWDEALLTHELFHVVVNIYHTLNEEIGWKHEETGAYLIQYLFKQAKEARNSKKKKGRPRKSVDGQKKLKAKHDKLQSKV